jgi:hypothetical protein
LPPNLKLADTSILDPSVKALDEGRSRHQVALLDDALSCRDAPAAVFQRSGVMTPYIDVPVLKFSSNEDEDGSLPPPPPESMQLNSQVFGLPLRLDILQTVRSSNMNIYSHVYNLVKT